MPVWEEAIELSLPNHEGAQYCYDDLVEQPILSRIFEDVILPIVMNGGDVLDRIRKIEAARLVALEQVEGTDEMVMYQYVPFDCCILDMYNGFIYSLGTIIRDSDLSRDEKNMGIQQITEALSEAVPWNPFKQMELMSVISTFHDGD